MREHLVPVLLIGALNVCSLAPAQKAEREVFGAVAGNVSCSDTNLPARLTSITLQPADAAATITGLKRPSGRTKQGPAGRLSVQKTHLDGSFAISKVKPGIYYVIVQKPGYLSPVAQFSLQQIEHPTDEEREQIAKLVPMVAVNANQSSHIEVRLERAASISGAIRYDDGAAVPEMNVGLLRRTKDGKWTPISGVTGSYTDDLGAFRATGLPAGEYLLSTRLRIEEKITDVVFGSSHSTHSMDKYSLEYFFGDTFHKKDAKALKLEDGQDFNGADFTIPLSKLHTIAGSLVEARSGRIINAGKVVLYTTDDNTEIASAEIDPDEQVFHFDFVPEGNYIARVGDARDITREELPMPPDRIATTQYKETVLRSFGKYEGPLLVQTDMTGITLPIPEKESGNQKASATQ